MKLFLFCYPHDIFFEHPIRWSSQDIERLDTVINVRYRQQGWKIGYVTYNNWNPITQLTRTKEDLLIKDGQDVYHDKKTGSIKRISTDELAWPTPKAIVSQLPTVADLRVGGFHEGSCVDMIAEEAYRSDIKTLVDEEVTDLFRIIKPEDALNPASFPGMDRCRQFRNSAVIMEHFLEQRAGKPWNYDWSTYKI
jgi:hypothetical protein